MFHMIEPSLQHQTADDEVSFDMFDHAAVHVAVTTSWVSLYLYIFAKIQLQYLPNNTLYINRKS